MLSRYLFSFCMHNEDWFHYLCKVLNTSLWHNKLHNCASLWHYWWICVCCLQTRDANAGNATQVLYAKDSNCANLQPSTQENNCLQNLILAGTGSQLLEHTNTFFLIFFTGHPKCVPVLHHISQNSTANEYHVLTPWRVFNANFKFLSTKNKKT